MKTGLVLEGGGMRGIYTAGVLDVFMEQGICLDGVIGVSAGAIHGSTYVSGQKGRSIRYYRKYCADKRFMSVWSLIHTGDLVGREFCYKDLPERLDPFDYEAFEKSPMEFYVVCSNLETGKAEYLRLTDPRRQMDLLRASASMPYVSHIVEFEGKKLLDGGCCDSIPVRAASKLGFSRSVVVLTQHDGYMKKQSHLHPESLVYRKYPAFAKALERRPAVYNRTLQKIREWEKQGKIFVIRPHQPLLIGRMEHDPEKLQAVYDMGREDAEASLEKLKTWLAANA